MRDYKPNEADNTSYGYQRGNDCGAKKEHKRTNLTYVYPHRCRILIPHHHHIEMTAEAEKKSKTSDYAGKRQRKRIPLRGGYTSHLPVIDGGNAFRTLREED